MRFTEQQLSNYYAKRGHVRQHHQLDNRKNKLPVGFTTFKEFVPLLVVIPLADVQPVADARLVLCCKVQPDTLGQYTLTVLPDCCMHKGGTTGAIIISPFGELSGLAAK